MVGGLIGSVCVMICSLSQTNVFLAVFLFISGMGYAMTVLPSEALVICVFGDNYLLPFCVNAMGGGVGMMILPFCVQKLLPIYGWRGALLILGGFNLHTVVSGALFQAQVPKESVTDGPTEKDQLISTVANDPLDDLNECSHGESKLGRVSLPNRCCSNVREYLLSNFRVVREFPLLIYMMIAAFLHGITHAGWTIFVIANAEFKGIQEETAVFLSIAGGVGNTIGRLFPSALNICNKDLFTSRISFLAFGGVGAVPLCLNSVTTSFPVLIVFAGFSGLALGAKAVCKSAATVDIVSESSSSTALAFALVCSGMGELAGGWLTGKIWDVTGSLEIAFLFLGLIDILGVVTLLLSLIHQKLMKMKSKSNKIQAM
ncbi:monocarboxylate transporter 12-like [Lytechinus variegatus]|uniref:monocarboxylate transporter 12-like n=1 Tax=Lytechinus variegatus TaxID=7654 RepID=UPI001BB28AD9|nr:monocarboxylate transporter 12-like [Lytechinus variegatus]